MTRRATLADDPQRSLDPEDWDAYRVEAHRMLDELLDQLRDVAEGPVWHGVPDAVKRALSAPLPREGTGIGAVWGECRDLVMAHGLGNRHPRFFGWVQGAGTVGGMLGELAAAALNANVGGREHAPVYVERQVIGWFRELFGFPDGASGVLVEGSSMANLMSLAVARTWAAGPDVRARGLEGAPLVGYASEQVHACVVKAFEVLGFGREALHLIPTDAAFRIDVGALRARIAADRAAGLRPFFLVGCAGTVNTGAVDPLAELAELAKHEKLWFHVDGAFGALVKLSSPLAPLVDGLERADSLAFDLHKWLHVPYDAACVLVRDGALHLATFAGRPAYLAGASRGAAGGEPWFCDYGVSLSRGFRALKVWFTLKEHGAHRLGEKIQDNCALAADLGQRVMASPALELAAPVSLNICCFRYRPRGDAREGDRLNADIVAELHERGIAVPSTTTLNGRLAIRVNISNHRTRRADLELLLRAVHDIGARLDARPGHGADGETGTDGASP